MTCRRGDIGTCQHSECGITDAELLDVSPFCPDCGHRVAEHLGDLEIGLMCSHDDCGCVGLANDDEPVFR